MTDLISVEKNGEYLEVHPTTLADHKANGWKECEAREVSHDADQFDAMSREELKAYLTEKNVDFAGNTGDVKLRVLCRSAV